MNITNEDLDLLAIPASYVPIDFQMDPRTDDLVRGDALQDGAIVLFEDAMLRGDPARLNPDHPHYYAGGVPRIRETARWARVTSLTRNGRLVLFIAVYADGTKSSRTYAADYCWYVKK